MFRRKLVVYTCLFGFSERFNDFDYADPEVDYICFTDDPELRANHWKIVHVPKSALDRAKISKKFKALPALHLSRYDVSLYVDNVVKLKVKPSEIFERFYLDDWVMLSHPWRNCLYQEAEEVIRAGYDTPETVGRQIGFYKEQGYPENNGLNAGTFILRRHNEEVVKHVGAEWWAQILQHSRRDQLSWNYCAWQEGFKFHSVNENLADNTYFSWPHIDGPRLPRNFSDKRYLSLHPDVAVSGVNPRWHYINYGHREGRAY